MIKGQEIKGGYKEQTFMTEGVHQGSIRGMSVEGHDVWNLVNYLANE